MRLSFGRLQIHGLLITVNNMEKVYFCLGSNVGNKRENMEKAMKMMEEEGVRITKMSKFYETQPVEVVHQDWFVNAVAEAETDLEPEKLLIMLKNIESKVGRKFTYRWGPRIVDVDILIYGDRIVDTSVLTIPHKLMDQRRFVLEPLAEIAPGLVHPVLKKTVKELLNECKDMAIVSPL